MLSASRNTASNATIFILMRIAVAAFCCCFFLAAGTAAAADYVWHNVKVGGGGFIPTIVFSPAERGLAYLGSDMGGAYRWDAKAQGWLPLQNAVQDPNLRGVESIAPDPVDPNVVYAAVGTYRRDPAAIIRSADRGATWTTVMVPFRMGGNEEGRGLGPRLAVDPNDTSVLYYASRYDGLQKSTDAANSWSKVGTFPVTGLGVPERRERPHAGLSFVVFDPSNGTRGSPSKTIFVGVADPGEVHLYRSDDAGQTWFAVKGGPRSGLLPAQAQLDGKGILYVTYSDSMGPYGVRDGAVFKLDTHANTWTDITPEKGADRPPGGYNGLSLDRQQPDTLVVASIDRGKDGDIIWRSTDVGAHWQDIRALSVRDVSSTPYLLWGKKQAGFGWWQTGLAIDPFDSGHVAYTTGATVYGTSDFLNARTGATVHWRPWVDGVEQTAILTLTSPPAGPHLLSGFGDIGGFAHFDLDRSEPIFEHPIFINTNTIDYAGRAPNVVVRSGTHEANAAGRTATLAYSTDSGKTWRPLYAPAPAGYVVPDPMPYNHSDPYTDAAIVTSADGKRFTVMTPPVAVFTSDRGKHWSRVKGLPAGGRPVPDRANARRSYAVDFAKGIVFASRDGGAHFRPLRTKGLPADLHADRPAWREIAWPLMATPGFMGDLWYLSGSGLYHSSNGGRSFVRTNSGLKVAALAFGKTPPGKRYPALFAVGTKDNLTAIWRSDDAGRSWLRVNDEQHEYGRTYRCIAGDPRIFGRVYVGTDGFGIVYGEPEK